MSEWAFHNPVQIQFGAGSRSKLSVHTRNRSILVVTTKRGRQQMERDTVLADAIAAARAIYWADEVQPNPGLSDTQGTIDSLKGTYIDLVVAFGGGSAMDAAKALAASLSSPTTNDLAELISQPGVHLTQAALRIIALPTTSGTGAEVTPFATIWDHKNKKKLSLASQHLFPSVAIVDPELTYGLPKDPTFSTGLDALNQAFESLWNNNRTPITAAYAGRAISLALPALKNLNQNLSNKAARIQIAEASLLAGLAISHTRTAICHSMSYPLTAHYGLPHGWACAATMQAAAELAFTATPEAFSEVAKLSKFNSSDELLAALNDTLVALGTRDVVSSYVKAEDARKVISEMYTKGRGDNYILPINDELLAKIIKKSFS